MIPYSSIVITRSKTKEVLYEDRQPMKIKRSKNPANRHRGSVRSVMAVRLSHGFNSAGVECGIELPVSFESPADIAAAMKYLKAVERRVEDHLAKKANEARKLLMRLAR